jgi:hypothetical protein
MGVHPTAWGYAVYQDVMDKLIHNGIPRAEIADIGSADTDAKKQVLFEKLRQGNVRVLLGSTQKMGTGTNVQQRLVALHHLDAPWKPAEVEQRDGRILRQGNTNAEVAIYRYVTAGSFDAYMWQALETKAKFITQVMTGDSTARRAEDVGGQELSYAEVKAIASGNPAVLTLAEADAERQRLLALKRHHADEQYLARKQVRDLPADLVRLERRLAALTQDLATAEAQADAPLIIGERACPPEEVLEHVTLRLRSLSSLVSETRRVHLGVSHGLHFSLVLHPQGAPDVCLEGATTRAVTLSRDHHGPRAVLNALERLHAHAAPERDQAARDLGLLQDQLREYTARLGAGFAHEAYLRELTEWRDQLEAGLSGATPDTGLSVEEVVARLKTLQAAHRIEAAPRRRLARTAPQEEPITARIRQRASVRTMPLSETLEAPQEPEVPHGQEAHAEPVPLPAPPPSVAPATLFEMPATHAQRASRPAVPPTSSYRERVTRDKRTATEQLRLF